jgi:RNA polymerase sigma factor (sigma-70 family)
MSDINAIRNAVLTGTDESMKEAYELLYNNKDLQKTAYKVSRQFSALATLMDWEDVFHEAVIRVVVEIQAGRGPRTNLRSYFHGLCRNVCTAARRKGINASDELPIDYLRLMITDPEANERFNLREVAERAVGQLGDQCSLLMWLYYLEEPPVTDKSVLAERANEQKKPDEKPLSAGSIPQTLTRCREKLRIILKSMREDLDDFFNTFA